MTKSQESSVIVPSKPDTNTSLNGNGTVAPSKPDANTSSNGNSAIVSSKTSTNSLNEKQMNDTSNNLKAKNGKELPQTGDVSHAVAVIMGAITLGIAGIISFFKRNDD